MEYVKKYWYLVIGALVLLFFVSRRSGATMQQVGGSDSTTLALAQMASAERGADLDRQYGLANSLLGYDLSLRQVNQTIPLANIQAQANALAMANQNELARLSYALQYNQTQQQAGIQQQAINQTASAQRRNDYLSIIGSGIQAVLPHLFGNSVTNGGFGTPPIFGSNAPTYRDLYPAPPSVVDASGGWNDFWDSYLIGEILL